MTKRILATLCLSSALFLAACSMTPEEKTAINAQAEQARIELVQQNQSLTAELAATQLRLDQLLAASQTATDPAEIAALQRDIQRVTNQTKDLERQIAAKDQQLQVLTKAQEGFNTAVPPSGDPTIVTVASGIQSLLPFPFNSIVGILAVALPWGFREVQKWKEKKAMLSIINGIDAAKAKSPSFAAAIKDSKPTLLANYTPLARRIVADERVVS